MLPKIELRFELEEKTVESAECIVYCRPPSALILGRMHPSLPAATYT